MDGEEDWIWGGEGPSYVDVQEIRAQLSFSGSLQALREIRSVVVDISRGFLLMSRICCDAETRPLMGDKPTGSLHA